MADWTFLSRQDIRSGFPFFPSGLGTFSPWNLHSLSVLFLFPSPVSSSSYFLSIRSISRRHFCSSLAKRRWRLRDEAEMRERKTEKTWFSFAPPSSYSRSRVDDPCHFVSYEIADPTGYTWILNPSMTPDRTERWSDWLGYWGRSRYCPPSVEVCDSDSLFILCLSISYRLNCHDEYRSS